jgi:hypothetical protein
MEPCQKLSVKAHAGDKCWGINMRTFIAGTTTIDVIAHIGPDNLELDRLVLSRFEGSELVANAAFKSLVERYGGRPLAEYALAPREIDLS